MAEAILHEPGKRIRIREVSHSQERVTDVIQTWTRVHRGCLHGHPKVDRGPHVQNRRGPKSSIARRELRGNKIRNATMISDEGTVTHVHTRQSAFCGKLSDQSEQFRVLGIANNPFDVVMVSLL